MGKNIPLGPPSKGEYVVLPPSTRSFAGETPALRFPLLKGVARRAGGCNHPAPPSFSGLSCGKHTLAPYPATIKGLGGRNRIMTNSIQTCYNNA